MPSTPSTPAVVPLFAESGGPLLDPDSLSREAAKAVEAFNREGQSANTARTYRTALQ